MNLLEAKGKGQIGQRIWVIGNSCDSTAVLVRYMLVSAIFVTLSKCYNNVSCFGLPNCRTSMVRDDMSSVLFFSPHLLFKF